jgi:hypothetical protein
LTLFWRALDQGNVRPCIKPAAGLQATLDFHEFGTFRAPPVADASPGINDPARMTDF